MGCLRAVTLRCSLLLSTQWLALTRCLAFLVAPCPSQVQHVAQHVAQRAAQAAAWRRRVAQVRSRRVRLVTPVASLTTVFPDRVYGSSCASVRSAASAAATAVYVPNVPAAGIPPAGIPTSGIPAATHVLCPAVHDSPRHAGATAWRCPGRRSGYHRSHGHHARPAAAPAEAEEEGPAVLRPQDTQTGRPGEANSGPSRSASASSSASRSACQPCHPPGARTGCCEAGCRPCPCAEPGACACTGARRCGLARPGTRARSSPSPSPYARPRSSTRTRTCDSPYRSRVGFAPEAGGGVRRGRCANASGGRRPRSEGAGAEAAVAAGATRPPRFHGPHWHGVPAGGAVRYAPRPYPGPPRHPHPVRGGAGRCTQPALRRRKRWLAFRMDVTGRRS